MCDFYVLFLFVIGGQFLLFQVDIDWLREYCLINEQALHFAF